MCFQTKCLRMKTVTSVGEAKLLYQGDVPLLLFTQHLIRRKNKYEKKPSRSDITEVEKHVNQSPNRQAHQTEGADQGRSKTATAFRKPQGRKHGS